MPSQQDRVRSFTSGSEPSLAAGDTTEKPEDKVRRAARAIVTQRRRPLFIWCETDGLIDHGCVDRLKKSFAGNAQIPELDLLLQSPGGDIHAAYRSLRVLRRSAVRITALIPFWCKSAATFLTLGMDELLFGADGELGPLDTQLHDPAGSHIPTSALNEFRSLEYLRNHALETLDLLYGVMHDKGIDVPHAMDRAQATIGEFIDPLYHQVRAQNLGQYARYLAIGEEYGKRAMSRWGYVDRSIEDIETMVRHLVWDYPAHEFVIDLQEAQQIGLNAKPMDAALDRLCAEVIQPDLPIFELFGNEPARPEIVTDAPGASAQGDEAARVESGGAGNGRGENSTVAVN